MRVGGIATLILEIEESSLCLVSKKALEAKQAGR